MKWGGGGVVKWGGGGGVLCNVTDCGKASPSSIPYHMPYRWKPSPHRVMAAAAIYWLGVSESNNIASAKYRGRLIQMDR